MKLIFATNNKNKLQELKSAVATFDIFGLSESGIHVDIPETGVTLKENAAIKARFIYDTYGFNCFADDTGLMVDALNGEPGVYSARYSGPNGDAESNMKKLLENLTGKEKRTGRFQTVICLILDGKEHFFEGKCHGIILAERQGEKGFGYDPIFQPDGFDQSFAQMSMTEKNRISHRGLAVKKLVEFLNSNN